MNFGNTIESPEIHILIVDDHWMIREGLKAVLRTAKNGCKFNISEAGTGDEAIGMTRLEYFDIILMDYILPDMTGVESVRIIIDKDPAAKVIGMSVFSELNNIKSMISAGARGFIIKNIAPDELLFGIRTVLNGSYFYSTEIAGNAINVKYEKQERITEHISGLTRREIEILKMIAGEMTNSEIAKKLFIGKRTVDTHRQNILNKLNAKNTVGLVKTALKLNLVY
jgi:DNA-binding NarL/FixJ family response regulator